MNWEPWTGCYPASEGCTFCYFYGKHSKRFGQNEICKTDKFDWPIKKNKKSEYCIKGDKILATCFGSDFFLAEADNWRSEAWAMIKERSDIEFLILTKRIDRFTVSLPADWNDGYDNVFLGVSVENQQQADARLPMFLKYPIKRRFIACAPLLGEIDLSDYLSGVEHITANGESGKDARVCKLDWIKKLHAQALHHGKTFWFKSSGTHFEVNDEVQTINPFQQGNVAKSFNLDILSDKKLF